MVWDAFRILFVEVKAVLYKESKGGRFYSERFITEQGQVECLNNVALWSFIGVWKNRNIMLTDNKRSYLLIKIRILYIFEVLNLKTQSLAFVMETYENCLTWLK